MTLTYKEYSVLFFAFCILFSTLISLFLIAKKKNKNINDFFKFIRYSSLLLVPAFIFSIFYFEYM